MAAHGHAVTAPTAQGQFSTWTATRETAGSLLMRESSSSAVCRFLPVFFPTEIYYLPQCPGLVAQVSISRLSVFAPARERMSAFFQTEVTDTLVRTQKTHAVSTSRLKMNVNSIRCWPFLVLFLVFASSAKNLTSAGGSVHGPQKMAVKSADLKLQFWHCLLNWVLLDGEKDRKQKYERSVWIVDWRHDQSQAHFIAPPFFHSQSKDTQ